MAHKLRDVRKALGLTIEDLADLSGVAKATIRSIENGTSEYKINQQTAQLIAEALSVKVRELFLPIELSHLGRPPATGQPISISRVDQHEQTCSNCFMHVRPINGKCPQCEHKMDQE